MFFCCFLRMYFQADMGSWINPTKCEFCGAIFMSLLVKGRHKCRVTRADTNVFRCNQAGLTRASLNHARGAALHPYISKTEFFSGYITSLNPCISNSFLRGSAPLSSPCTMKIFWTWSLTAEAYSINISRPA